MSGDMPDLFRMSELTVSAFTVFGEVVALCPRTRRLIVLE
jgi:hypothetical protein